MSYRIKTYIIYIFISALIFTACKTAVYDGTEESLLKRHPNLHSSTNDTDYINEHEIVDDFDCNGTKEKLFIEVSDDIEMTEEDTMLNSPITIKLSIGTNAIKYEDPWNDGIKIHIIDFDTSDSYKDICIIHSGTDVSYLATIYRYNGKSINKYTVFEFFNRNLIYDKKGNIYYYDFGPPEGYFYMYDYNKKQVIEIK